MIKRLLKTDFFFAIIVLVAALISRGLFLEYYDLIDPTESRYASVAVEMLLSNDWVTPKLPMPEGVVPYMGKPPLHFWMTMGSYKIFGINEWTARLPSFISALFILGVIAAFTKRYFGAREALTSVLIAFSSGMFFFLAGASVTDVTLTACVSLAVLFSYKFVSSESPSKSSILLAAFFCALAFMCKGPIGIVLVGLPLFFWSIFIKDFSWLKRIPWISSILVFLIVVTPWFVMSEIRIPGFLKYFFWNENIARYLLKDYGDKYGSGHKHMFGASWIMLFLAFCPWTVFFVWSVFKEGKKQSLQWLKEDKNLLFVACWAFSTPLFFTFVRQLHAMYLLPAIPGLAILTAIFLNRTIRASSVISENLTSRKFLYFSLLLIPVVIITGMVLDYSTPALLVACVVCVLGGFFLVKSSQYRSEVGAINFVACLLFVLYLTGIAAVGPYIDQRRSSGEILKYLVSERTEEGGPNHVHHIGILTKNSYSHYWMAKAWQNELGEKIVIEYVEPKDIPASDVCHYLLKTVADADIPKEIKDNFILEKDTGTWKLYMRNVAPLAKGEN